MNPPWITYSTARKMVLFALDFVQGRSLCKLPCSVHRLSALDIEALLVILLDVASHLLQENTRSKGDTDFFSCFTASNFRMKRRIWTTQKCLLHLTTREGPLVATSLCGSHFRMRHGSLVRKHTLFGPKTVSLTRRPPSCPIND